MYIQAHSEAEYNYDYFAAVLEAAAFCALSFRNAAAFFKLSRADPDSNPFACEGGAALAVVFAFLFDVSASDDVDPLPFAEPSSICARLFDPSIERASSGSRSRGFTRPSSSSILRTASMNSGVSFEPIPFLPNSTRRSYSYTLAFGFGSSVAQLHHARDIDGVRNCLKD